MIQYHHDLLRYTVAANVYKPAEDTFLLAKIVEKEVPAGIVFEAGTGCGLLSLIAAKTARHVVASDINPYAVLNACQNARLNGLDNKVDVVRCDLSSAIRLDIQFDCVIFNPPYLPLEEHEQGWLAKAWAGGTHGVEVVERFIASTKALLGESGVFVCLVSGEDGLGRLKKSLENGGLSAEVLESVSFFYEKLFAVKAQKGF